MMNNEEDKRCPICTEAMDWTDLQFNPCKCGYQVCVWCWHHIIDMAKKDEQEGRCPACRTIYDKEKIVVMKASCESRTEIKNIGRKRKEPKPKADEAKKDLTNQRVIQRKMAYVIGLPHTLANEDVLQRREFFGRYGKVTKISLSRTAGGTVQQFINDTCSVYVTYSKEEEALRCIQSVHGFFLDGKLLRASFGTAKYCHSWLKNMSCINPSCLYLHTIGADEDIIGKDEEAALHTRNQVEKVAGFLNNNTRRSGNVLPPPFDVHNITDSFTNKSISGSSIPDVAHGFVNSNLRKTSSVLSEDTEGAIAVPQKMASYVDIVGRSNVTIPETENDYATGDMSLQYLCSELSSVTVNQDIHLWDTFLVPVSSKISNADNTSSVDDLHREDTVLSSYNLGSSNTYDSRPLGYFVYHSHSANTPEHSSCPSFNPKSHSLNHFTGDFCPVYTPEDEAILPIQCVNSVLDDSCQIMKFHSSAKYDRTHSSSLPFSTEEIVEKLRCIDDDTLANYEEGSVLHTIESSIISNIMSIDLDSSEDPLSYPHCLPEFLDDTDGLGGSSWSSSNSDQSGYDPFSSQMALSLLPEYWEDSKKLSSQKSQYPVTRVKRPPGFSFSSRDQSQRFTTSERNCSPHALSGMNCGMGKVDFSDTREVDLKHLGFETLQARPPKPTASETHSQLRLNMHQSQSAHLDCKLPPLFPKQSLSQELSHLEIASSEQDAVHASSRQPVEGNQAHDYSSLQKQHEYGYAFTSNGFRPMFDRIQRTGEAGNIEYIQTKERLWGNNYVPVNDDMMFSSNNVFQL